MAAGVCRWTVFCVVFGGTLAFCTRRAAETGVVAGAVLPDVVFGTLGALLTAKLPKVFVSVLTIESALMGPYAPPVCCCDVATSNWTSPVMPII